MEYAEAYGKYAAAYNDMRKRLEEWVISKKGSFDKEGEVQGLEPNMKIHYDIRAEQLIHLLDYAEAAEQELKLQREEIKRLKTENRLLLTAERNRTYTDEFVMQQVNFYKSWSLDLETNLKEFREHLSDTIKFFDIAIKRQLIETDPIIESKLKWSVTFLKDEERLRQFYFTKKHQLKAAAKTPVLDEYTKALATNA